MRDLEHGTRRDDDARIDRVADGAHQPGAHHGQAEQGIADGRDADVGDDQIQHLAACAEKMEERSGEQDQQRRASDVERQHEDQTVGGEKRGPLPVAGADGPGDNGTRADADAPGRRADDHEAPGMRR